MLRNKWLVTIIISGIILGSLQVGIMYDCLSHEKNFGILKCLEIVDKASYIQEISTLSIQTENSTIEINAEIADDLQEQIKGLMFRSDLGQNDGMLFVYETERKRSFWMKNTLIPLDMIFVDTNMRIIDIKENIQPCVTEICPNYTSKDVAKYILEVNAGFVMKNNIEIGDLITLSSKT